MMKQLQDGFTLVEVVMVIVIVTILVTVVMPRFFDFATRSKTAACKSNQNNIESAAAMGYARSAIQTELTAEHAAYPASINIMVTAGLLDRAPACPSGGSYAEQYNASDGTVACSFGEHAR